MSQESVLGLQGVAENALESGRWPSDEPEALNGSSHGHGHDDIEEEDEHPMADGAETELELGDGEDATVKVTRKPGPPPMIDTEVSGPSPTSVAAEAGGASPAGSTRSLPTVVEPHRPGTPAAQSAQAASFSQASLESARTQLSRRTNNNDNNPPPSPSRRHLHTRSTPSSEPVCALLPTPSYDITEPSADQVSKSPLRFLHKLNPSKYWSRPSLALGLYSRRTRGYTSRGLGESFALILACAASPARDTPASTPAAFSPGTRFISFCPHERPLALAL